MKQLGSPAPALKFFEGFFRHFPNETFLLTVLDKANARHLTPEQLPFVPDLLTMDVSFISVSKVLPAVLKWLA